MPSPLSIAVLISGGGTTLKNILTRAQAGELPVAVKLVISSSPTARGLQYAADANIPAEVFERKRFNSSESYGDAIFTACRNANVNYVVMGGFLKHVTIPTDFENRVVNIHPSLIPAFCGKGMYGHFVHEAVLDFGAKISGCTVHFVDNQYDHGPIILQRAVPVLENDTAETLAARVFEQECEAYPEALRLLAEGNIHVVDGKVRR